MQNSQLALGPWFIKEQGFQIFLNWKCLGCPSHPLFASGIFTWSLHPSPLDCGLGSLCMGSVNLLSEMHSVSQKLGQADRYCEVQDGVMLWDSMLTFRKGQLFSGPWFPCLNLGESFVSNKSYKYKSFLSERCPVGCRYQHLRTYLSLIYHGLVNYLYFYDACSAAVNNLPQSRVHAIQSLMLINSPYLSGTWVPGRALALTWRRPGLDSCL